MQSDLAEFRLEQFKNLCEEKRSIDRYMWQLPIGALAVVAVVMNFAKDLIDPFRPRPLGLLLISAGLIPLYAALVLGRLHLRRETREARLEDAEREVNTVCGHSTDHGFRSTIRTQDLSKGLRPRESPINLYFGRVTTSTLGITLLLLVAGILFGTALYLLVNTSNGLDSALFLTWLGGFVTGTIVSLILFGVRYLRRSRASLPTVTT